MNNQQMTMPDGSNVPIPTYAYFNKANETTGPTTLKNKFDVWVNNVCRDVNPDQGSVDKITDISTFDEDSDIKNKLYTQYLEKNKNPADYAVASVVAGVTPTITDKNKDNQIKYLACQVAKMHAREYDSNAFAQGGRFGSVKEVFTKFASMKPYLALIFFISIYLYLQGIMSSLDVGYNIATNLFKGESSSGVSYWGGLLFGISLPFLYIMFVFGSEICKSLASEDRWEITNNPYGEKESLGNQEKKMDYWMVMLFILFIYGFVGVLYTIGTIDKKMNWLIGLIIFGVLAIITVFLYIFYNYTPFIATAQDMEGETSQKRNRDIEFYVKKIDDVDEVKTSAGQERYIKTAFVSAAVVILILACGFFYYKGSSPIIRGALGASAILALPVLWVFNTVLAFNYFYLYPIFLMVARAVRYVGMIFLYKSSDKMKGSMSSNLSRQLEDEAMKDFSPSWNLIGVSLLKTVMNLAGMENNFSKQFVDSSMNSSNFSQNSLVSGLYILSYIRSKDKNKSLMYGGITILVLTLIIWAIILFGVEKINMSDTNTTTEVKASV